MYRLSLTLLTSLAWLIASPSLQWRDAGWVEVGATPAAAQTQTAQAAQTAETRKHYIKKKAAKKTSRPARIGSSGVVTSNQPGKYPIEPITPPQQPNITGTVIMPERDPRYPNVPTVPIIPRGATGGAGVETSQDRVVRCTHQGALGGLSAGQQGAYVQNCAF